MTNESKQLTKIQSMIETLSDSVSDIQKEMISKSEFELSTRKLASQSDFELFKEGVYIKFEEVGQSIEESKRHLGVLIEHSHDKIDLVAEQYLSNTRRIEVLEAQL